MRAAPATRDRRRRGPYLACRARARCDEFRRVFAARALHDGLAASSDWTLAATVQAAQKLGWALLRDAVQGAADEIALRCALKLPRDLDPAPVLPPEAALALVLSMLEILDAEWLSSFPAQA